MIKYVYPGRETTTQRERQQVPIMYTNVSTYAQTLMKFHETNPVPTNSSNKRLKIRLNEYTFLSKRNSTLEDSTPIFPLYDKIFTFIEIDSSTPAGAAAAEENINIQTKHNPSRPETTKGRSTIGGRGDNGRRGPYGK